MDQCNSAISRLPQEILLQTARHFTNPKLLVNGDFNYAYEHSASSRDSRDLLLRRKALENLRLVNRSWHAAATALFVPLLRIRLNEESLARAVAISKVPELAAGIQCVQLVLNYCPGLLANDVDKLRRVRDATMHNLGRKCWEIGGAVWFSGCHEYINEGYGEETAKEKTKRKALVEESIKLLKEAEDRCVRIKEIWRGQHETASAAEIEESMQLIQKAADQCKVTHVEQQDLIKTGRFTETVAQIMCRMKPRVSLAFADTTRRPEARDRPRDLVHAVMDDEEFIQRMAAPLEWNWNYEIQRTEAVAETPATDEVPPAALLCDVPIALIRAGVTLQRLQIHCWPLFGGTERLHPEMCALKGTQEELIQAMGTLESLSIRPWVEQACDLSPEYPAPTVESGGAIEYTESEEDYMIDYIEASISGKSLRHLAINCKDASPRRIELDNALRILQSHQLRTLDLRFVWGSMEGFKHVMTMVDDAMERWSMCSVTLYDGTWCELAEKLRESIGIAVSRGTCSVHIDFPEGQSKTEFRAALDRIGRCEMPDVVIARYMAGETGYEVLERRGRRRAFDEIN